MTKMAEHTQYYLELRIPGIDENWMKSNGLSAKNAYHGYLSLRDFEFTGERIIIKQRKGKHTRVISEKELRDIGSTKIIVWPS